MSQHSLDIYGTTAQLRVSNAISHLRAGRGILLVDDEDRENEGDLIFAAELISEASMATLIRDCSGIVCLCLQETVCDRLDLPPMVDPTRNTSRYGTGFTVSIEARHGVSTGVSAADRVTTVRTAINPTAQPKDLARPGHVFPLRAKSGGVRERRGHTEGAVDLVCLAGLKPAAVLCELMNPDGTMARLPEVCAYAKHHGLTVVSIDDIVKTLALADERNVGLISADSLEPVSFELNP